MTTYNQTRYRYVNFQGGRVLEAREVIQMQEIAQGIDILNNGTPTSGVGSQAVYRQGALYNATITVSGTTCTVSATNGSLPVSVFVRDRWENFISGELASVTLAGGGAQTHLFLNWQIVNVTYTTDPSLVEDYDGVSPAANMGQLNLEISATDTSGATISGELYRNSAPIYLCNFTYGGGIYTVVPLDNVQPVAYGSANTSGLVSLTTNTSSGKAASSDDSRLSDSRTPTSATVINDSVRTPVSPGGTNADGTTVYNLSSDVGGISAAKIVITASTQILSEAWAWLVGAFTSLLGRYNGHETAVLGLTGAINTHPMPTAADVGGVPLSHIPLGFNVAGSHPATVSQSSGGYVLNRGGITGAAMDPAYGVFNSGVLAVGLNHDGDVYSDLAGTDGNVNSGLPGQTYSGPLALLSNIANVLAAHVNEYPHANPHGLTLADLGYSLPTTTANFYNSSTRVYGTTYTNSGTYAMTIAVTGNAGSGGGAFVVWIGTGGVASTICASQARVPAASSDPLENVCVTFVVPPGWSYMVQDFSLGFLYWVEWVTS